MKIITCTKITEMKNLGNGSGNQKGRCNIQVEKTVHGLGGGGGGGGGEEVL